MRADWLKHTVDLEDVWQGPAACIPMLQAFMRARGTVDVSFTLGVQTHRPGKWIILIQIEDEQFAVEPANLRNFGRSMLASMKFAERMGAPPDQIAVLSEFANCLVSNAEQALSMSPHGLH